MDVVLSPQRRSFGGGCHVTAAVGSRRAGSPLEKENDGVRVIGGRRIGSGRIISARNFDKDHRGGDKDMRDSRDARDRDRERDYKDKRFRVCSYLVFVENFNKVYFAIVGHIKQTRWGWATTLWYL